MHWPMKFAGCDLLTVSHSFFPTFVLISPNIGTV
jgi:hypothetical protein